MDKNQIEKVIRSLEAIRLRPYLYMSPDDNPIRAFIGGFNWMLVVLGLDEERSEFFDRILTERGWNLSSVAPYREMQRRGMSLDEIIEEILSIEIEIWKRVLAQKQAHDKDEPENK